MKSYLFDIAFRAVLVAIVVGDGINSSVRGR